MIQIRPETSADAAAIRRVHTSAFPTDAEARLVDALRANKRTLVSLVADDAGEVVGHILFTPVTFGDGGAAARGAGLAPVAVTPAQQRRGIGARLIEAGIVACRDIGIGFIVVLGDPAYYRRFGFARAADRGLTNEYGVHDEFMVLEIAPHALMHTSGLVKYAPEFREAAA